MDLGFLLQHLPHDPLANFAAAWHPYEFKCAFSDGVCTAGAETSLIRGEGGSCHGHDMHVGERGLEPPP